MNKQLFLFKYTLYVLSFIAFITSYFVTAKTCGILLHLAIVFLLIGMPLTRSPIVIYLFLLITKLCLYYNFTVTATIYTIMILTLFTLIIIKVITKFQNRWQTKKGG